MSVLIAMPAKVGGAAASEGEVRSTVAWWQVCRRGMGRELDAMMNAKCEQRKAGCYKADQKQDAGQSVCSVGCWIGGQAKLRERGL
jgi:hypothetical protein